MFHLSDDSPLIPNLKKKIKNYSLPHQYWGLNKIVILMAMCSVIYSYPSTVSWGINEGKHNQSIAAFSLTQKRKAGTLSYITLKLGACLGPHPNFQNSISIWNTKLHNVTPAKIHMETYFVLCNFSQQDHYEHKMDMNQTKDNTS